MKISKLRKLLVILTMLVGALSASAGTSRFFIQPFNILPGDTQELTLSLDNDETFYGFQTDVTLPSGMKFVTDKDGKAVLRLSDRCNSTYTLVSNFIAENTLRIGALSTGHSAIEGTGGPLLYISVSTADDFNGGAVQLSEILFVDAQHNDVQLPDNSQEIGTELQNSFYIPDFSMVEGEIKTVQCFLTNEAALTSFQTDLYLPAGLNVDTNSFKLTSRGSSNHAISTHTFDGGPIRIAVFSPDGIAFTGNDGALMEFEISANNKAAEECVIYLKNQRFATAMGKEYTLAESSTTVTVEKKPIVLSSSISLDVTEKTLKSEETVTLTATVLPSDATDKTVVWNSSDVSVATVDANGIVKAVAPGSCQITATTADGSNLSATCNVTVEEEIVVPPVVLAKSITLDVTEKTLKPDETVTLTATVLPSDANDKTVVWNSSDVSVATVDANGIVKAVAPGSCQITATTADGSNLSATCNVTVEEEIVVPPVVLAKSISLDITEKTLKPKETVSLTATVLPENATDKTVVWNSSDVNVATVDANGVVTAIAPGSCQITVTTADGSNLSATCEITVEEEIVVPPLKEYIVQVEGIYYRVDPATREAEVVGSTNEPSVVPYTELTEATIVATVEYDGEVYDVTSISESAFNTATKLETVIIEESTVAISVSQQAFKDSNNYDLPIKRLSIYRPFNITSQHFFFRQTYLEEITISGEATTIGDYAFYGSTALKSVTLGEKVTDVGYRAFLECNAITKVTSYAAVPPSAVSESFDSSIFPTATLYVYKNSLEAYKGANIWKNFYNIQPLDPNSGIDNVEYDKPVTVYTVSGILINRAATADDIAKLSPGLYIINGKKVMVK